MMHRLLYIYIKPPPLCPRPRPGAFDAMVCILTILVRSGRAQIRNFLLCGGNGSDLWLRPDGDAFGAHNLNIRDADEGKHRTEIGFLMFGGGCGGTFRVDTATRGRDNHALAAREALDPRFRMAKGLARNEK